MCRAGCAPAGTRRRRGLAHCRWYAWSQLSHSSSTSPSSASSHTQHLQRTAVLKTPSYSDITLDRLDGMLSPDRLGSHVIARHCTICCPAVAEAAWMQAWGMEGEELRPTARSHTCPRHLPPRLPQPVQEQPLRPEHVSSLRPHQGPECPGRLPEPPSQATR